MCVWAVFVAVVIDIALFCGLRSVAADVNVAVAVTGSLYLSALLVLLLILRCLIAVFILFYLLII